jgi:uncharacterized protein (DUF433 family)
LGFRFFPAADGLVIGQRLWQVARSLTAGECEPMPKVEEVQMVQPRQFTVAEAAFVLREPTHALKKALEATPVRPVLLHRAGIAGLFIGGNDLLYLYAVRALRDELTPKALVEFYEALQRKSGDPCEDVRFGRFRISVGDLIEEVRRRIAELAELADSVEFWADGEPVLKGTQIEIHRIARLLDGESSVERVLEDYPSLSLEDLETANTYADTYPKAGRPYPHMSAKQALQRAGLEALDDL